MEFAEVLRRRPQVEANAHREANAALKAIRFVATDRAPALAGAPPQAAQPYWDLTEAEDIPVLAWKYFEAGGPAGLWGGETVRLSWRKWVAGLFSPLAASAASSRGPFPDCSALFRAWRASTGSSK
ncbi:MAG: hypothetical protein GY772_22670 [bacterium]|nr:hypothetical protein [bacterium]